MKIHLKEEYYLEEAQMDQLDQLAAFQVHMAWETEAYSLDLQKVTAGAKSVLEDPQKGKYYVVKKEGKLIACLLTTYEWSEWRNAQVIWIQSLYVVPEHRKKGLFKAVYQYLKDLVAQNDQYTGIRLYVDKSNQAAIKVYQAIGMDNQHYEMFEWLAP